MTVDSSEEQAQAQRKRKSHIVIVDDNPITRLRVEVAVSQRGYTFDSAADGLAALSTLKELASDVTLVLADIEMPRMTGIQLLDALKGIPDLAHVPVILMSSPDREREAMEAGCADFLAKPFSVAALMEVLDL